MDRREFLIAAGVGGLATTAGCQTAVGAVALPEVPQSALAEAGFTKQDETVDRQVFEKNFGPVTVEAVASSVTYEDTALAKEVSEKTLGTVEASLAMFSATRVEIAPDVADLGPVQSTVTSEIEANARGQLAATLEEYGLENVEQTNTGTIAVDSGAEASLTEFTATYPIEDITVPVYDGRSISLEGTDLEVAAVLAVWAADDGFLVSGGAYPAENFATTKSMDLSDAISISVDVDLGLTPDAYREELLGLVRSVA